MTAAVFSSYNSRFRKVMSRAAKRIIANPQIKVSVKKPKTKHANVKTSKNAPEESPYFENNKSDKSEVDVEDLGKKAWTPPNWEQTLENIREMRRNKDAPVDTMGCDKCMGEKEPPEVIRFHALVSLMLSSQTKDEVTFAAMERLKNYKTGLNIKSVMEMPEETLGKLIYPVGFWKRKSKYLKDTAKILNEKYNGDIPDSVESLCSLPGVGPKMAYLCMKTAWGVVSGIGVDTHVHRISNRIGWVKKETKTPEQTRIALESWLPKNLWEEINSLLVGFGQQTCKPVKPLCGSCANQTICPFGKKQVK